MSVGGLPAGTYLARAAIKASSRNGVLPSSRSSIAICRIRVRAGLRSAVNASGATTRREPLISSFESISRRYLASLPLRYGGATTASFDAARRCASALRTLAICSGRRSGSLSHQRARMVLFSTQSVVCRQGPTVFGPRSRPSAEQISSTSGTTAVCVGCAGTAPAALVVGPGALAISGLDFSLVRQAASISGRDCVCDYGPHGFYSAPGIQRVQQFRRRCCSVVGVQSDCSLHTHRRGLL